MIFVPGESVDNFFLDVGKKHDNDELQGKNMTCQEYDQKMTLSCFDGPRAEIDMFSMAL